MALNFECSVNPDFLGGGTGSLKGDSTLGPAGSTLAIGKYTIPVGYKGSIIAVEKCRNAYRPFCQPHRGI